MATKTIIQNLRDKSAKFVQDPAGTREEQSELASLATRAVMEGMNSDAWRDVMKNFAVNNKQLRRLRGRDEMMTETWAARALAYIASGGICSIDSLARADIYLTDDGDDRVKGLVADGGDPTFNEVDPDFPGNAEA